VFWVLGGIAVLSGTAALLFETLWFRLAGLAFGNSVWASSIVLAGFMCGLGLGNAWAAGLGGRLRAPTRVYAILEVLVAASGLSLVLFFPALTPFFARLFGGAGLVALNTLRLLGAFLLLVVPTAAMGATLPVLVTALSRKGGPFGPSLSWLYGANTLGAVGGALLGELVLIPVLGLKATGLVAAGFDLLAAGLAFSLPAPAGLGPGEATGGGPLPKGALSLFVAAAVSGGILLALEVVWFRFLLLFVSGFALSFAVMLAVVLVGISAGGLVAGAWLRRDPGAHAYASSAACLAGAAAILTYSRFEVPLGLLNLSSLAWKPSTIGSLSLWLMSGTSFFSGMIFCFVGSALKERLSDATRTTGALTLSNTFGASVGAIGGGFLLLPGLGIELSIASLAALYGCLALLLLPLLRPRLKERPLLQATPAIVFVLAFALFPFGFMRNVVIPRIVARYSGGRARLVAVKEGLTETIMYLARRELGGPNYRLVTNGFSMADTGFMARRYMQLYVYWPLAVAGGPKDALLVSYGCGSTASALASVRSLQSIDVVDISKDVLELGRLFFPPPWPAPLADPRVHPHVEDGRFFLQTTTRSYDLVTSEPPPPRLAGVVNLYTQEYFSLIRSRLRPGGVVTYWLPIYQLAPRAAKGVVGAFCNAFPDCSLWTGEGLEFMLVGTRDLPGPTPLETFRRPWQEDPPRQGLRLIGVDTPESLGALFLADSDTLAEWTKGSPALHDDTPGILTDFPDAAPLFHIPAYADLSDPKLARERFRASRFIAAHWPKELLAPTLEAYDDLARFDEFLDEGASSPAIVLDLLYATLRESRSETLPIVEARGEPRGVDAAEAALAADIRTPSLTFWHAVGLLAKRRYAEAAASFAELPDFGKDAPAVDLRALALCLAGDARGAEGVLQAHGRDGSKEPFWSKTLPRCGS
jgi:spermidine synthase